MEYFVLMLDSGRRNNIFTLHARCVALIRLIIHSKYVFTHLSVFFHIHCFVSLLFFFLPLLFNYIRYDDTTDFFPKADMEGKKENISLTNLIFVIINKFEKKTLTILNQFRFYIVKIDLMLNLIIIEQ